LLKAWDASTLTGRQDFVDPSAHNQFAHVHGGLDLGGVSGLEHSWRLDNHRRVIFNLAAAAVEEQDPASRQPVFLSVGLDAIPKAKEFFVSVFHDVMLSKTLLRWRTFLVGAFYRYNISVAEQVVGIYDASIKLT
jgi:hypothetical protein